MKTNKITLRGVVCITHRFPLVATPDHPEYIAKCPLTDCPSGIKRFSTSNGSHFDTSEGAANADDLFTSR